MTEMAWPTEPGWHLGVTGSRFRREGGHYYPSPRQKDVLRTLLYEAVRHGAAHLHQGCCTGWDEHAVRVCQAGRLPLTIHGHQPESDTHLSMVAVAWSNVLYKPLPYHTRDRVIATRSQLLLAGPAYPENDPRSKRSGTWLTVRMGRDAGARLYAVDQLGNVSDAREAIA